MVQPRTGETVLVNTIAMAMNAVIKARIVINYSLPESFVSEKDDESLAQPRQDEKRPQNFGEFSGCLCDKDGRTSFFCP